jgi:glycosyltransferase involved in cell wall biosynthesis
MAEQTPVCVPPTVSIGLPVFNGERFLAEAIDSLLVQTFRDFELTISDNASTDRTGDISQAYAARDGRVRYVRQPRNLGAAQNWNFVVTAATGSFFKWASANDRCEPTMLEKCVKFLRQDERVVLCYGKTALIDDDGSFLGDYEDDPEFMDATPSRRLIRLLDELRMNNAQCGLIRMSALRRTRLERAYSSSADKVLMAELVLQGGYRRLPEVLLHRRIGRESATKFLSESEQQAFLDPVGAPNRLVAWLNHADYLRAVLWSNMGLRDKSVALAYLLRRAYWDRRRLWSDVVRLLPLQRAPARDARR